MFVLPCGSDGSETPTATTPSQQSNCTGSTAEHKTTTRECERRETVRFVLKFRAPLERSVPGHRHFSTLLLGFVRTPKWSTAGTRPDSWSTGGRVRSVSALASRVVRKPVLMRGSNACGSRNSLTDCSASFSQRRPIAASSWGICTGPYPILRDGKLRSRLPFS